MRLQRSSLAIRLTAILVVGLAGLAGLIVPPEGAPAPAFGVPAGLTTQGTPTSGEPLVLTAEARPNVATPRGEQTLRLAGPTQGPASLDPAVARDLSTGFIVRQLFRGLTRLDHGLTPVPEIAERIEISADGTVYTFVIRANAVFHNGRAVVAQDIAFSLAHALNPATAGGQALLLGGPTYLTDIVGAADVLAGRATTLAGVTIVDGRTVRIALNEPRGTFLMKLAGVPASIIDPNNVAQGGEWWRRPNGTGPFTVAGWVEAEQLVLRRFDGFFNGPAPLEQVSILLGPNAISSFNLYEANAIDLDSVPLDAVERVMAPGSPIRGEVTVTPLFATSFLAFRTDTPPMDDPHVRRAISLAFPRGKLADVTYGGHRQPAHGLVPPTMLGAAAAADAPDYDLQQARHELALSRYGEAGAVPPLRIYGAGSPGAEALRDVLAVDLGLAVEVISVQWLEFNDGLRLRAYPAYELYWGADYPDPETFLSTLFGGGSADNYVDYRNDAFDALLNAAARELDQGRRSALYAEAQQILIADHVLIPLYHDMAYTLAKPYVRGLDVTPLGILQLETVWLEH